MKKFIRRLIRRPLIFVIRGLLRVYLKAWREEWWKNPDPYPHQKVIWELRQTLRKLKKPKS